ncbi:hypothetical protein G7078_10175 [Sphingomonas sinipercae]|uniref:Uncharacterized protein n=1 Tax=Sphingomonas sinipercae TaxID=2714944 RepID=A0A6G7ZQ39_9SPHN|nr:hypothetical protein [Sphingomonas sinipercae]QIL03107.1 hypothetical protein G7078_10175 [Sphingomonas sinipercae]
MKAAFFIGGLALVASVASAQARYERYTAPTNLAAELPGEIERFDKWTDIAKGRVIQLTSTVREQVPGDNWPTFKAYYFVQAVIADQPYDIDAKMKELSADNSDAAASFELIGRRPLKPSEMPIAGMRGIETTRRISTFGSDGSQIERSRDMFGGNKWLSVSVRHFENDKRWSADRLFKSVSWRP